MSFDIVIIGAGPAGLCFARSLAGSGLRIALVERQPEAALVAPADDGREIAITHHSQRLMRELGLWARLHDNEIGTLRDAMVIDGDDSDGLMFRHDETGKPQLGWLLSNHAIRRAAYAEVMELPEVERITGVQVTGVRTTSDGAYFSISSVLTVLIRSRALGAAILSMLLGMPMPLRAPVTTTVSILPDLSSGAASAWAAVAASKVNSAPAGAR